MEKPKEECKNQQQKKDYFRKDKYWNQTLKCWETKYSLFNIKLFYKKHNNRIFNIYLFKLRKHNVLNKAIKTYSYHDVNELLNEYGSKWSIPMNSNWKYIRDNKEISFKEI